MKGLAYYNEFDPKAAKWLEMLILEGDIAPGHVDTRSIEDVRPGDLAGYTQCHFFAGIGGWSLALRMAGWPDDRAVWTGSCPCQPFSQAGKGGGFDDSRHLWPAFGWLIDQCAPSVIFGEQVASPAGLAWVDVVLADLESSDYACAAADICAAGVGAPHIRQRLYWMGHANSPRRQAWDVVAVGNEERPELSSQSSLHSELGDPGSSRSRRNPGEVPRAQGCIERGLRSESDVAQFTSAANELADHRVKGRRQVGADIGGRGEGSRTERLEQRSMHGGIIELAHSSTGLEIGSEQQARGQRSALERGGTPWDRCEWIQCRDGKSRPVEPGTFPLAHGVPGRVGLLRGYGNAIVPQDAAAFIGAYLDV